MTPLEILKYVVGRLEGSILEPWGNLFLFLLFLAVIYKVIVLVLGKDTVKSIKRLAKLGAEKLNESTEYAPGAEAVRKKIWPYVNFVSSIYMSILGLFSFFIVALAYYVGTRSSVPINLHVLAIFWILASLIYSKVNIAQATWAWHEIKQRRANKWLQVMPQRTRRS